MEFFKLANEFLKERSKTGKSIVDLVLAVLGMVVCGWASKFAPLQLAQFISLLILPAGIILMVLIFRVVVVASFETVKDAADSSAVEKRKPE